MKRSAHKINLTIVNAPKRSYSSTEGTSLSLITYTQNSVFNGRTGDRARGFSLHAPAPYNLVSVPLISNLNASLIDEQILA